MINLIILDTNIYRQLGIRFFENIDYKNLLDYCYASGSEIRLSEVVYNEFISFYFREYIDKPARDIENATKKLSSFQPFKDLRIKIQEENIEKSKREVEELLLKDNHLLSNQYVPVELIVDFLVKNKQETKKDNTRDFLIWLTVLSVSQKHPEEQVILISQDKIFSENEYFMELSKQIESKNKIKIFKSISDFLNKYGGQYDFLTKELIEEKIPYDKIEHEITKELNSFPGYISNLFYHSRKNFEVEYFKIKDIKVDSFYSYKDIKPEKNKFLVHFKVDLKIIYGKENPELIEKHLENLNQPTWSLETFDKEYKPVFDKPVMFIFEGELNVKKKVISKLKFIDFFIDYYFLKDNNGSKQQAI